MSDDIPEGFRVEGTSLAEIIYSIDPDEAVAAANISADEVLREYERENPEFAKEQRKRRRALKAWQRERDRLADEVDRLQTPLLVAILTAPLEQPLDQRDHAPTIILQVSDFLFNHDAPAEMIRDLLQVGMRLLPPEDQLP